MTEKAQSILIVEDDRQAARALQQALGRLGYDAYAVATSAEEAVSHASKRRPDLVLVDVGIKGQIDGIDAAVILHGRYGVPIVYLAEPTDESTIERATSTGFFMYLLKPVRPGELRTVIALALRNHEAAKAPVAVGTAQVRPRVEGAGPVARGTHRSTVLLADDHAVLREGLAKLLTEHDFEVVGAVADGDQLLDAAKRLRPDVIVTDISMPPGLSGLDVLDRLKAQRSRQQGHRAHHAQRPGAGHAGRARGRRRLSPETLGRRGAGDGHSRGLAGPGLLHVGGDERRHGAPGGARRVRPSRC